MKIPKSRALKIKGLARNVIHEHGFTSLPVDPRKIAEKLNIEIQQFPPSMDEISGCLMKYEDSFAIGLSTAIKSEGFQNFTIAHELGHYYIDGHPEALLSNSVHYSKSYDSKGDKFEREADLFASELLMPWWLIQNILIGENSMKTVKQIAFECITSLTASAIKLVNCSRQQVAMLMLNKDTVDYMIVSDEFRFIPKIDFIEKGEQIPEHWNFIKMNSAEAKSIKEASIDCLLSDIFIRSPRIAATIEVIGLGSYGRVLCLISCDWSDDERQEEANTAYIDRWQSGCFRPKDS